MEVIGNRQEIERKIEKPNISIGLSIFIGGIQLFCVFLGLFHSGSSDTNTMLIWYVIISIPSVLIHAITFIRIKLFVKKPTIHHYKLFLGHYLFGASLILVAIHALLL